MSYLIVAAIVVVLLYSAAGRRALRRHADWRAACAMVAIGLFASAGFEALRGGLAAGILLSVIAMALTGAARWPRQTLSPNTDGAMSERQARNILGVGDEAGIDEIRAAYARLIRRVHPDKGGAPGLAAQLNLARDRLLKG